ncbi:hypothetical protein EUX98_g918 [Antrodiella citrinella]|uniref:Glycosyltransferase family 49 protein n=1 Tax=Antrodiella citrinella TaxID=2447956 RepID=A0A4S4N5S1_9APHY|nr:hypothetical protein EUX98_g918 [Antrodiella citrinella]
MHSAVRILQLGIAAFVCVAVLYTTKCVCQLLAFWITSLPTLIWTQGFGSHSGPQAHGTGRLATQADIFAHLDPNAYALLSNGVYRSDPAFAPVVGTIDYDPAGLRQKLLGDSDMNSTVSLSQDTLLSKAFSQSLHPTRIIPYFYRATGKFDDDDVTITTLVTSNRFKVLKQLVERYRGPISVTIHIPFPSATTLADLPPDSPSLTVLHDLHDLYHSTPHFGNYVDVHLALSPFSGKAHNDRSASHSKDKGDGEGGRQFNVWRNVARLFSRTEFVMMLDVDFAVCTDWRGAVRRAMKDAHANDVGIARRSGGISADKEGRTSEVANSLREGSAALVLPVFEYISQEDGEDQRTFPQDKESLLRLVNTKPPIITSFHASWAPGHNSTNYPKYYSIPPGADKIYKVETYQSSYEPYVITSKWVTWCDERFTGYGANKAACLFEMYLSGVSFYVLSDHFLIHQNHKYEEEARREERKYNRKLYTDFKEEACLRYLYRFHHEGTLDSPKGSNVKAECKKIKSVTKIAAELLGVTL